MDKTIMENRDKTLIEPDATIREKALEQAGQPHLSSFRDCDLLSEFPAVGGEADIYLAARNGEKRILKLYRYGMNPKEEVLKRTKELSRQFPGNIVSIYEYGYDEKSKRWYEIQEYARYGTLKDISVRKLDNGILSTVVKEISDGLKVLHDNDILHLDLKPSNILVRSLNPLDLIFTDFGIASILDPELSRKMTSIKGTPLYWSPEAFTGVVGKEADYWSLGMIILEFLLGSHPFSGLDTKVIMYTLSTKGVSIPEEIDDSYKRLLMGLLTREPQWRWGFPELSRWLKGDSNIPVCYTSQTQNEKRYHKPYTFRNREYGSAKELLLAFIEDEENWKDAREHILRGYITKWLESNEDYETGVRIERLKESSDEDPDLAVVRVIYSFNTEAPFVLYGKLITVNNLHFFAERESRGEGTESEGAVLDSLLDGRLLVYYEEYLKVTSKSIDSLHAVIGEIKKASSTRPEFDQLKSACNILDIIINPGAYLFPSKVKKDPYENILFVAENIDLIFNNEEYRELTEGYIVPQELILDSLQDIAEWQRKSRLLHDLTDKRLLMGKEEYGAVQREYIVPSFLNDGISGVGSSGYGEAVGTLNNWREEGLLIIAQGFADYMKRNPGFLALLEKVAGNKIPQEAGVNFLKALGRDGYVKAARLIRNNVTVSLLPSLNRIEKAVSSDSSNGNDILMRYIKALKSCEVRWDAFDKRILNEINTYYFKDDPAAGKAFGKLIKQTSDKEWTIKVLEIISGMDVDVGNTRKREWSLWGAIAGAIVGVLFGGAISVLRIETNILGIMILGAVVGMVRRSNLVGLLAAFTGLIGEVFYGNVMTMEIAFVIMMGIIAGASIGTFLGGRRQAVSFEEQLYNRYSARFDDLLAAEQGRIQ